MATRDAYVEKMKTQLDKWNTELRELESKADKIQADVKSQYEAQIQKLRQQWTEGQQKVKEIQEATGSAWEDFTAGVEKAWKAMSEGLEQARSRFK